MLRKRDKTQWCTALRSGKFRQTKGALKGADGGYCCLGVFAHIKKRAIENRGYKVDEKEDALVIIAPEALVAVSIPLSLETAFGFPPSAQNRLVEMNDSKKRSFKQIANWIEKNM